jgi:hypothetical protein
MSAGSLQQTFGHANKAFIKMILARFFRPRWQHSNPQVRRQALLRLSSQDPEEHAILQRLAAEDTDAEVRKAAVKHVSDLAFLRQRAETDPNAGAREVASARYRQLLAGGCETSDLDARLAELSTCNDEIVLGYVARRAREAELRLAALDRLQSASVFEEVAIHDAAPRVRQAAVARLTETASLERVIRHTRERDRRVARMARDMLQQLQRDQEAEARAHAERVLICEALERLAASGRHDGAERQRLLNRWQAVGLPPRPEVELRFQTGLAQYQAAPAVVDVPPVEVQAAAAVPDLDVLLAELRQDAQPDQAKLEQLRNALAAAAAPERQEAAQLQSYLEAATRYLDQEAGLASAVAAVQEADTDSSQAVRRLQKQVEVAAWRSDLPQPRLLEQAEAILAEAMRQDAQLAGQREKQRAELEQRLVALTTSLAAGRLKESQRLLALSQKLASQLAPADREQFERQLRHEAGRVRELQDWRRFATLPKQEELCQQMEALVDADLPPAELVERIQRLQDAWKATGGSASPEGQQLWERFHSAGNVAFDRCRDYLDQQAEQRKANLQKRQEIAEQLEQFIDAADWDRLELAGLEAIRAQARQEWQLAVPVDRRALRAVEARFEPLMKALTERIREKQRQHRERKEALIGKTRELIDMADVRAASEQAKRLQSEWKTIGSASANIDRRLWREFRSACDAIFDRRDSVRSEADQERQERLVRARAICDEVEALVADEAMDIAGIDARLHGLREEYRRLRPLPREEAESLLERLNASERVLAERRHREGRAQEESALAALRERVQLCTQCEQAALAGDAAGEEPWEERWRALAELPASAQAALEERWQRALAANEGQPFTDEELAANLEARRELCVRMEILAGIESPPDEQAYRMNLQVKRLADGLAAGLQQSLAEQVQAVELEWLGVGPALPVDQAEAFAARFERARELLVQSG